MKKTVHKHLGNSSEFFRAEPLWGLPARIGAGEYGRRTVPGVAFGNIPTKLGPAGLRRNPEPEAHWRLTQIVWPTATASGYETGVVTIGGPGVTAEGNQSGESSVAVY